MNCCVYHLYYPEHLDLFSSTSKRFLLTTGMYYVIIILMMSWYSGELLRNTLKVFGKSWGNSGRQESSWSRRSDFLRQLVSKEGCKVDPEDSKVVSKPKQETPTTVKEVRQLLRLLGYYRKYIPHFSQRARCLYAQLLNWGTWATKMCMMLKWSTKSRREREVS